LAPITIKRRLSGPRVPIALDPAEFQKHAGAFDFILDTVSAPHDTKAYLELLKHDATMTLTGAPPEPAVIDVFRLLSKRRLAGTAIGGVRETQEMLDFCAEHAITADIEKISIQEVNQAYERLLRSDIKYRLVIDMASLG
jgi:alcohol dehydrogenase (NADP+)